MITYFFSIVSYFTSIINVKDISVVNVKDNVELKNLCESQEKVQEKTQEIRISMEFEDCKYW